MKFFILAFKKVELRGIIVAKDAQEARDKMKEYWQMFDTNKNSVTAETMEPGGEHPILSEAPGTIQISYIEEEDGTKHRKGILTKLQKEGKWKEIA